MAAGTASSNQQAHVATLPRLPLARPRRRCGGSSTHGHGCCAVLPQRQGHGLGVARRNVGQHARHEQAHHQGRAAVADKGQRQSLGGQQAGAKQLAMALLIFDSSYCWRLLFLLRRR